MSVISLSLEEFQDSVDNYLGVCLECGELRDSTEPDAENYDCPSCESNSVMGLELALISGHIDII